MWRDPFSVQFGVDPPRVRLNNLTDVEERMLAALAVGVGLPGLAVICSNKLDIRDDLLARLAPVLLLNRAAAAAPLIAVSGTGGLATAVTSVLAGSGVQVVAADTAVELEHTTPDIAVIVGQFVLAPANHAVWLRRDIPHLGVVASDSAVTIGPIVEPGHGACLLCVELHRRDADPAWPAIATQLLGRQAPAHSAVVLSEASAALARTVLERLESRPRSARSVRIDSLSGAVTGQEWLPHTDCGCRGIAQLVAVRSATSHP